MKKFKNCVAIFLSVFLLTTFFYVSGTGKPAGYADSDELVTIAYQHGVAHPSGFPLLITITHILMRLFSSIRPLYIALYFVAFLQATSAISVFYLSKLILTQLSRVKDHKRIFWSSIGTAGILSFSYLFWTYGTIFEVVSFTNLLTLITLISAFKWNESSNHLVNRYFFLTCVVAGILIGHYQLGILILPALLVMFAIKSQSKKITLSRAILLLLSGLVIISILFLLSNSTLFLQNNSPAQISWNFNQNISGWIHHVVRTDYTGVDPEAMVLYKSAFALPDRIDATTFKSLLQYFMFIYQHFGVVSLLCMSIGTVAVFKTNKKIGLVLTSLYVVSGFLFSMYLRATERSFESSLILGVAQRQYFIGEISLTLMAGIGIWYLLSKFKFLYPAYVVVPVILIEMWSNHSILISKDSRVMANEIARYRLSQAKQNALIICTNDIDCYSLFYESLVEKNRPDVTILTHSGLYNQRFLDNHSEIYPYQDREIPDFLGQLIAHNIQNRPVYLTSGLNFYSEYSGLESGPFYLNYEGLMLRVSLEYPDSKSITFEPVDFKSKTFLDKRDEYGRGIVEVLSNNQAYAGYLSLLYQDATTSAKYLKQALFLDPDNGQAMELLTNIDKYALDLKVDSTKITAADYLKMATENEIEDKNKLIMNLRFASYLEPKNKTILEKLSQAYANIHDYHHADLINTHKRLLK